MGVVDMYDFDDNIGRHVSFIGDIDVMASWKLWCLAVALQVACGCC
jgi:hypothetical protein